MPPAFEYAEVRVFEAIKNFVTALTDGEKDGRTFDDNDHRLAMAALLLHAAAIDGKLTGTERGTLAVLLKQRFALDDATTDSLVEQAAHAERDAIDLYQFTSRLNRTLDDDGRRRVVEMMWQIAFSDGAITEFEGNLIWRAADLLHVSQHERIALRRRVAADRGLGGA
jgi:uncharacterized tellurite resistance protein B-like protein